MPKSMTGYGVADGPVSGGRLQFEIRTVNHRHFSASLKLCSPLQGMEIEIKNRLRGRLARGHVSCTARWMDEPERPPSIGVNLDRAREVVAALRELKTALDLPGEVDVGYVARQPDVIVTRSQEEVGIDAAAVFAVVDDAVEQAVVMRQREGDALGAEVNSLLDGLVRHLDAVEDQAPKRLHAERDRLRRSVAELLDGRSIDDDRLSQEIALIADKLDITEELVRLRSHVDASRDVLGRDGPAGRELSFLGQEMLREVNTIGSKANDTTISQAVVASKGLIERLREQIENLE